MSALKAALACFPCEIARLKGRIKNKDWSWKDVPACKYMDEFKLVHRATLVVGLIALGFVAYPVVGPALLIAAVILAAIKLKNTVKDIKGWKL